MAVFLSFVKKISRVFSFFQKERGRCALSEHVLRTGAHPTQAHVPRFLDVRAAKMPFAKIPLSPGGAREQTPKLLATNSYEAPTCSDSRSLQAIRRCAADSRFGGTNSPGATHLSMEDCALRRNPDACFFTANS